MKKYLALILIAGFTATTPAAAPMGATAELATPVASDWRAKRADNICGLKDLNQLSHPSVINFKRCLAATPEMKKMEKDGIKPGSPEGIRLKNAAVTRVSNAADTVRTAGGYCSVWKKISHKDGRRIPDLTTRVVGQY